MIWMFWFNMCMYLHISFYLLFQPFFQKPLFYGHCLDIIYSLEDKNLCEMQNNCLVITYVQLRGMTNYWQIKEVFCQVVIILCCLRYKIRKPEGNIVNTFPPVKKAEGWQVPRRKRRRQRAKATTLRAFFTWKWTTTRNTPGWVLLSALS